MVRCRGFSLIEIVIALAIIAILAIMAVPSVSERVVRDQVVEAAKVAEPAKVAVAASWRASEAMPADNAEAGLPVADKIVGNYVSAVAVEGGAVHITFGNNVNADIRGKVLSLRPAVVEDAPVVPVAWVCAHARVPEKMTVQGADKTDLPAQFLPVNCR
jgi:type IV pilus assembly protein PilA